MRPGKSILFGQLGRCLYFGLPGPPFAVQALFYALILPLIRNMQGYVPWKTEIKRATLLNDIQLSGNEVLRLQEGVLFARNEVNMVRLAQPNEVPNCYIYCHAGRKNFQSGTLITVQPIL